MGFSKSNCRTAGGRKLRPLLLFAGFLVLIFCPVESFAFAPAYDVLRFNPSLLVSFVFCQSIAFAALCFLFGNGVQKRKWNVNIVRKIVQLSLFFMPLFYALAVGPYSTWKMHASFSDGVKNNPTPDILKITPLHPSDPYSYYSDNLWIADSLTLIISGLMVLLWTLMFSPWVTKRFKLFAITFMAIDRPEDRPFTLKWLRTEIIATYAIILLFIFLCRDFDNQITSEILILVIFVSSIGDALSGIIGCRYGKHPYKVKALFTKQEYARTLEGSACLFLSAVAAIAFVFFPAGAEDVPRFLTPLAVVPAL